VPLFPQQPDQKAAPKDQYFSGTVTAIDETSLSVTKTVLGKGATTQKFLITAETRFDGGKPKLKSRVNVRYVTTADGDRAVRVIVRAPATPKK